MMVEPSFAQPSSSYDWTATPERNSVGTATELHTEQNDKSANVLVTLSEHSFNLCRGRWGSRTSAFCRSDCE